MKKYKTGLTTGVYDMFHIGHLNVIRNAKAMCEQLIVGVSTDELVEQYKNKTPIVNYENRRDIVAAIRYVDLVVPQNDMNKLKLAQAVGANSIFVGSDWQGTEKWNKIEAELKSVGIDVVYLPHTDGVSSTMLRGLYKGRVND